MSRSRALLKKAKHRSLLLRGSERVGISDAIIAAATMGTSDQTLPFFTQFFQFEASYDDLPTFMFFVIAMALVGGYLVLSLPFSIVTIVRPMQLRPDSFSFWTHSH
ncbi:hypothetical protein HRI_004617100 [Hibiscus trionum]|uniref:CASP-like protein n=1 Tax=Hibiscus trionum TaxID=183268 RepID=A0A9W7JD18_HIBTR|nr:hypothetical protein HRI_004617100 [Hibiscus trionum]